MPAEVTGLKDPHKTAEMYAQLDQLREQIDAGNVRAIGVAVITKNREIITTWNVTANGYLTSLLGGLDYLKYRLCKYIEES